MSRDQYTERLVQLVSALVASGRYRIEWKEPGSVAGDDSEFDNGNGTAARSPA